MIVLSEDNQQFQFVGGGYIISTIFDGGTASLEVKQQKSQNWVSVGTLTETPQIIILPADGTVRLSKTGNATVEISR